VESSLGSLGDAVQQIAPAAGSGLEAQPMDLGLEAREFLVEFARV
jgi:hypothetical protein